VPSSARTSTRGVPRVVQGEPALRGEALKLSTHLSLYICVLMSNFTLLRCCAGPPAAACRAYADPLNPH